MRKNGFPALLILLLVVMVAVLAYFLGRKNGTVTVDNIATNEVFIKQISELASLEAQGVATIKRTNILNDGSISDQLKKFFMENTINISVPYIAKYGINLNEEKIDIKEKDNSVIIYLPSPQLLSYELRMDKIQAVSEEGVLLTQSHDYYNVVQQSLYSKTRKEMENNATLIQQSKEKIIAILSQYYQPLHYKVQVIFSDSSTVFDVNKK